MSQVVENREPSAKIPDPARAEKAKFRCKIDHVGGWLNVYQKEKEGEVEIAKVYLHLQQRPESVKIGKIET
jgi:hypothetical protein